MQYFHWFFIWLPRMKKNQKNMVNLVLLSSFCSILDFLKTCPKSRNFEKLMTLLAINRIFMIFSESNSLKIIYGKFSHNYDKLLLRTGSECKSLKLHETKSYIRNRSNQQVYRNIKKTNHSAWWPTSCREVSSKEGSRERCCALHWHWCCRFNLHIRQRCGEQPCNSKHSLLLVL